MFETMIGRVERRALARAQARRRELAERLARELPRGLSCEADEEGVRIIGRGAGRRLALDARLRALVR